MATQEKGVSIAFNYSEPRFLFTGEWSGHDVKVVQTLFRREYLKYQRSIRRDLQPTTVSAN